MSSDSSGMFINFVLSMLLKKIVVPSGFHDRVKAVKEMLEDDVTGLVDSLTDFAINSANVDFSIETESDEFTKILKKWLNTINIAYNGQIPSGIKPLAKEYLKERWKYSSLPILKISKWTNIGSGVIVPSQMFFLDGESIHAQDKNEKDENLKIVNYDYFLGNTKPDKLDKNVIITKPYCRWYDKYPTPYLIKRGVYHNYKIIQSLKKTETTILDQIIPYMLLIKKGTEGLAKEQIKTYSDPELKAVTEQFQELMDNISSTYLGEKSIKSPVRASNFDEEIKHLIPDLSTIFDGKLFAVAERNILSGLGFIDVVEATSTSRRESILNPKAFIEETKSAVEDFKQIIKELIIQIITKNENHIKYINHDFHICSSPVKGFQTDEFKNQFRLLWERGQVSNQSYAEVVGEIEYKTEVLRREKEAKKGTDYTMYPHLTKNEEGNGLDIPGEKPKKEDDVNGNPINNDKIDDTEKYNIGVSFECECIKCGHKESSDKHCKDLKCSKCGGTMRRIERPGTGQPINSELITAPYKKVNDLPVNVRKKLTPIKQKKWLKRRNYAYLYMLGKTNDKKKAETYAFRVAWSLIKKNK
jgi:cation transport regulator ChaB